jgi:hypothetical protein
MLAHDVFAEARTLVDAEHAGNSARHCADRAADSRANRTSRSATFSCAAFCAADHTLRTRCKRERRRKGCRTEQKFESHVFISSIDLGVGTKLARSANVPVKVDSNALVVWPTIL